jgi:prolyl oligopeptidase
LGITGGSNGGLVVGVAMTKRPDLFKVVIPQMGAFDMVKFDQFTVGKYHLDEYGNPEKKEEFNSLFAYSPYHNIDENTNYPTTLLITSDNDDRVPPLHSYKFAAKLQNRPAQKNPIYLISLSNSGHYGKIASYEDDVKSDADFYNFLMYHLNE